MMWAAGILASLGSITYPAISAFVSIHSDVDTQGMANKETRKNEKNKNKIQIVLFCVMQV